MNGFLHCTRASFASAAASVTSNERMHCYCHLTKRVACLAVEERRTVSVRAACVHASLICFHTVQDFAFENEACSSTDRPIPCDFGA